ncbi:class I SAM-dependent methyltransferase [Candidatus Micrarchaeota archaeon]|nr:class I SAM-dependent methyltransferase [Candidatus Micrarchaeota archaeon]
MKLYNDVAQYYDLFSLGLPGELEFYRRLAKGKNKVLEIACGTGRILLPIMKDGMDITGIDISQKMLEILKKKAKKDGFSPKVHLADMRNFRLKGKFDLIIIPYNAFLHAETSEDQISTLKCARRHLKEGGTLAMNIFFPWPEYMVKHNNKILKSRKPAFTDKHGKKIWVYDKPKYDYINQLVRVQWYFLEGKKLREKARVGIHLSFIYKKEFELLFRLAGFSKWKVYGGFKGEKLTNPKQQMVCLIRK